MMSGQEPIVGLDVGSSKVCALVAVAGESPRIVGAGITSCEGLKKGLVVNAERATQAIFEALSEAERTSGAKISEALIAVGGEHVRGANHRAVVAVARSDGEVREADVKRVCDAVRAMNASEERAILHAIPQVFVIDGERAVIDPIGMAGVRLEGHLHVVTGAVSAIQSLIRCARRAGVKTPEMVLAPYASSRSVLRPDELELGVALLDIGCGTTGIALYHGGALHYTAVLPLGGWHVTNDLVFGLGTRAADAEAIKIRYGRAVAQGGPGGEIAVPGAGGEERRVSADILHSIIIPRVEEILSIAAEQLRTNEAFGRLGSGVVLTGGTSLLPEIATLAERVFEMPARVGWPGGVAGLTEQIEDARYATAVGLVLHGLEGEVSARGTVMSTGVESFGRAVGQVTDWIKDFF
jgi:cell division protein FtsA